MSYCNHVFVMWYQCHVHELIYGCECYVHTWSYESCIRVSFSIAYHYILEDAAHPNIITLAYFWVCPCCWNNVMTRCILLIFHFIYHMCITTDRSPDWYTLDSILTLRSIAQSYCSHFPLFSILSSLLCCCAATLIPSFYCPLWPIVRVTLLFLWRLLLSWLYCSQLL